ncbi:MAG: PAS domain-containing sensor histidine kinase [Thermoanaerobaculia bacterium]
MASPKQRKELGVPKRSTRSRAADGPPSAALPFEPLPASLLSHIVAASGEMISVAGLDHRFTYVNTSFVKAYGYREDEVLGQSDTILDSPRNDPWIREERSTGDPGNGWSGVLYNTRKDGTDFPVALTTSSMKDVSGRVVAYLRSARDISQQMEVEESLRRSEEQFRSILEGALDGVITLGPQGLVERYNPAAAKIFGYAPAEVLGRPAERLLPYLLDSLGVLPKVVEMDALRRDGKKVPLELSLFVVRGSAGHAIAAFIKDISERREVERLKDEFVAIVSHDLKIPLSSVRLSLEILGNGSLGALSPEARSVLEVAERNVERMVKLANDLLDLKRLEAGRLELRREPIALGPLIERCFEMVRALATAQEVKLDAEPTSLCALGDDERIGQVLMNLLSNAIKFSPAGARVAVVVRTIGVWAEIRVQDQGRGIPLRHQEMVFERFRQVYPGDGSERKGSGLGLTICKAIVTQSGGTIGLTSRDGEGTCFWFRLKLAPVDAAAATAG